MWLALSYLSLLFETGFLFLWGFVVLVGLCVPQLAYFLLFGVGIGVGLCFVLGGMDYYLRSGGCGVSIWVFWIFILFVQACI